jgi:hypothetical protein
MIVVVDENGKIVQQGRKQVTQPAPGADYQMSVPIPLAAAGKYRVRLAMADASGNIGSLEAPVASALAHFGTHTVSDLFTMWAGQDGVSHFVTRETLPLSAVSMQVSLELYPDVPASTADLRVRFAIIPAGETTPVFEQSILPTAPGATRSASVTVPAERLKPGAYTIRASVAEGAIVIGTVTATIWR